MEDLPFVCQRWKNAQQVAVDRNGQCASRRYYTPCMLQEARISQITLMCRVETTRRRRAGGDEGDESESCRASLR